MADQQSTFIPKGTAPEDTSSGGGSSASFGPLVTGPAILLIIAFLVSGGIFLYKQYLQNRVDELNVTLQRLEGQFEAPLVRELDRVSQKIEAAKTVLASHIAYSRVFDLLEERTHTDAYFSRFQFNDEHRLAMDGVASGYTALSEQMKLLEESNPVEQLVVSNISLQEEGGVQFTIEVIFDESFLRYEP